MSAASDHQVGGTGCCLHPLFPATALFFLLFEQQPTTLANLVSRTPI